LAEAANRLNFWSMNELCRLIWGGLLLQICDMLSAPIRYHSSSLFNLHLLDLERPHENPPHPTPSGSRRKPCFSALSIPVSAARDRPLLSKLTAVGTSALVTTNNSMIVLFTDLGMQGPYTRIGS
jgi:hypothetical protein